MGPIGAVSAYQIIVSWVANSFPRPLVKRSAAIAIANMIGNTANIYGAYMYPSKDAPRFIPGGAANAVICLLTALMALVLRFVHVRENKKLATAEAVRGRPHEDSAVVNDDEGLAGRRATGFRYVY